MRNSGDAIQDDIVTVRNDRFVIPVKADFRGKVGGVAHGFSSSGATVFVEPLEAIEANNELQNLKGKEEREVARILFELTEQLREQLPAIETAVEAVAELDFIKAKVEFARKFKAIVPQISENETLELVDARHPLLEENLKKLTADSYQLKAISRNTNGRECASSLPKSYRVRSRLTPRSIRNDHLGCQRGRQNCRAQNSRSAQPDGDLWPAGSGERGPDSLLPVCPR